MSSGTGLLRVAFQGLSRPSLVKSLAAVFPDQLTAPRVSEDGRAYTVLCKTNEYHLSFFTWTKQTSGLGESAKSKFVWTNWTCSLKLKSPKNIRTIIVFATGFKFYSATTRTGALGRRFSNHNHF